MGKRLTYRLPLRLILVVPFVLQIFGTVGLVGVLSFRNSQNAVNEMASALREELTARIKQQLTAYVNFPFLLNQMNAAAMQNGDLNVTNLEDVYIFWQQASNSQAMNLIYCGREADGAFLGVGRSNELLGVGRSNELEENELQVHLSNAETRYLFHYYNLDDQGRPTTLQTIGDRPYDPRQRPWYQAAQQQKAPVWSDIYLDFDTNLPMITASHPVYSPVTQDLIGVCAVDFMLMLELNTFLQSLEIGKSGETFIVQRDGTLVSISTFMEENTYANGGEVSASGEVKRLAATESQNLLVRDTAQFLIQEFGGLAEIQETQQLSFGQGRDRQFVQVAPFNDGRGLDWLIVVVLPEADFMGQINANTRNTILLCLGALAIATGLGILTSRWITRPISHLSSASQEIAEKAGRAQLGEQLVLKNVTAKGIQEIETLSDSFNQMSKTLKEAFWALEKTNMELEDRVEQRTLELQQANAKITQLNERLRAENSRMEAELEVARQIQQMILPRDHELMQISELDIAGFMEAAAEVGGDYYDIIIHEGRITVGIGDVTGHGLQSGVLMIMVQTAVRTLVATGSKNLTQFLNLLNRVIYENAQRLSPGKNLTLSLLDYYDGNLHLSGQHEDVLVVRAASGKVEQIDTMELGFPLGMIVDIEAFVNQTQINLAPGDGIVLYTDGVTEAENAQRQLYGLPRLVRIVRQSWQGTSQEVVHAIMEDVRSHIDNHTIYDDLTLVVIKKK